MALKRSLSRGEAERPLSFGDLGHPRGAEVEGEAKTLLPVGAGWEEHITAGTLALRPVADGRTETGTETDGDGPRAGFAAQRLHLRPDSEPQFPHL